VCSCRYVSAHNTNKAVSSRESLNFFISFLYNIYYTECETWVYNTYIIIIIMCIIIVYSGYIHARCIYYIGLTVSTANVPHLVATTTTTTIIIIKEDWTCATYVAMCVCMMWVCVSWSTVFAPQWYRWQRSKVISAVPPYHPSYIIPPPIIDLTPHQPSEPVSNRSTAGQAFEIFSARREFRLVLFRHRRRRRRRRHLRLSSHPANNCYIIHKYISIRRNNMMMLYNMYTQTILQYLNRSCWCV